MLERLNIEEQQKWNFTRFFLFSCYPCSINVVIFMILGTEIRFVEEFEEMGRYIVEQNDALQERSATYSFVWLKHKWS